MFCRCAQSVSPVLDLVINCLPYPEEKNGFVNKVFEKDLSALVFKASFHLNSSNFLRLYASEESSKICYTVFF